MTRKRGRLEFKPIKQLAVVDGEIEPAYQGMHPIGIAASSTGKSRGIDRVARGQARDERAIGIEAPRPMQPDQRRTVAANFNFSLDSVLPKLEPAHFWVRHIYSPPRSGCGSHGPADSVRRILRPQALRPPMVFVLVVPLIGEIRQHLAREQVDVALAEFSRH